MTEIARKRRHARPKNAAHDATVPMFENLPALIWCPCTRGRFKEGHYAEVKAFGSNKGRPSGLSTYCKECRRLSEQLYRKYNKRTQLIRELRKLRSRIERATNRVLRALSQTEQS